MKRVIPLSLQRSLESFSLAGLPFFGSQDTSQKESPLGANSEPGVTMVGAFFN